MEHGFFDLNQETEEPHRLEKLIINCNEFFDEQVFTSISSNFPLLEYLHLDHRFYHISISDNVIMPMPDSLLKRINISSRRNVLNDKLCFKLVTTGDDQHNYFKFLLIPGTSQEFSGNTMEDIN
jgi:hypothetical protein